MDVDFAFVCDYGDVSAQKLVAFNIGFTVLHAESAPFTHPRFCFVAQLRAEAREAGRRTFQVRLIGPDGDVSDVPVAFFVQQPYPNEKAVTRSGAVPRAFAACENLAIALLRRAGRDTIAEAVRSHAGHPFCAVTLVASAGTS